MQKIAKSKLKKENPEEARKVNKKEIKQFNK